MSATKAGSTSAGYRRHLPPPRSRSASTVSKKSRIRGVTSLRKSRSPALDEAPPGPGAEPVPGGCDRHRDQDQKWSVEPHRQRNQHSQDEEAREPEEQNR